MAIPSMQAEPGPETEDKRDEGRQSDLSSFSDP